MIPLHVVIGGAHMGDTAPATLPRSRSDAAVGPCLFLVAQGNQPATAPARVLLGALDEVRFGRGARTDAVQAASALLVRD